MCRWIAYRGEPVALERYVTSPVHSLIEQSRRALESTDSTNGDGFGNHCDADLDNNGIVNKLDRSLLRAALGATGPNDADLNCDGIVNNADLEILRDALGEPPGPSGLVSP